MYDLSKPLLTTTTNSQENESSLEAEIKDKIDTWIDREITNAIKTSKFWYWRTTTLELDWNQVDTSSSLEVRLKQYYVKKLGLALGENKQAIDRMQQKFNVTQKGVELGLIVYVSDEVCADNCKKSLKRFFGLPEKTLS